MMEQTYPRIPDPPKVQGMITVEMDGLRLLAWVLANDGITASLSDEECERALYAGNRILTSHGMDPRAMARVIDAHRILSAAVRRREKDKATSGVELPKGQAPRTPTMGPMAPLEDQPIRRPPGGGYARAEVNDREFEGKVDRVQF